MNISSSSNQYPVLSYFYPGTGDTWCPTLGAFSDPAEVLNLEQLHLSPNIRQQIVFLQISIIWEKNLNT